jgi:uncharacterized protein
LIPIVAAILPMKNNIVRKLNISQHLERGKVLILYGARQVGKTTLIRRYLESTTLDYLLFTGDDLTFATDFAKCDLHLMKKIIAGKELLVIDEAQKIDNIGRALKLVVDHFPALYVIATGSSSFDLANQADEPLTGRKNMITLYPISISELLNHYTPYEIEHKLPELLVLGSYPNIITYESEKDKEKRIDEIKNTYLIRDILEFQKLKRPGVVLDLLKLLAFQIGNEVSTVELGKQLGLDHKTVLRYLELLEKSFVLFSLGGLSRNLRKEVSKMKKYYFLDPGIRNAVIANFNPPDMRNDTGQLWENFLISERLKRNTYNQIRANYYFWRTYDQKEIDLIEERGGKLHGYECKWQLYKKIKPPREWLESYPNSGFQVIDRENFIPFLT